MGALALAKAALSQASVDLSRLSNFFSQTTSLHNSRWAYPHELDDLLCYNMERLKANLLLGVSYFDQPIVVRPTRARRELGNLLIVAPTRGGKSLLAISQLLTWPHSVIVNDVKGELFEKTAGYRASLGKVYVIDPTGVGHRFDPLDGKHTEDQFYSLANHILYEPRESDPIFIERARDMLTVLFMAARTENKRVFPSIRSLFDLGLTGCAEHLYHLAPHLAAKFLGQDFLKADFTDRFLLSCWGTLTTKMRPLLTETVIRTFSASDFDASELMLSKTPVTVYTHRGGN